MANTGQESGQDNNMGASITRGILMGLPLGMIVMFLAFWLATDLDFLDSVGAALLPGISFGVFAGGFAGMAIAMAKEH
jgi:hypothetical protein